MRINDFVKSSKDIPVIMGPTASGKSALALRIAKQVNGEIISADSMQFYRGLDIGTAKPTLQERTEIPHHLLDTMEISEKSDIFRFYHDANTAIAEIQGRKKIPIVVGGSGLYLHALIYGLDPIPAKQSLRDDLDEKYDNGEHFPELQKIMSEKCPLDYQQFHEHRRKLIRAYEVFLLSGKQMTEWQQKKKAQKPGQNFRPFVLSWNREDLVLRIRQRTVEMLNCGWCEEAERMISQGLLSTPTAWQAIGYRQIADYLNGKMNRENLVDAIAIATRQYARRQVTWFAHQHPEATVIPMPCNFEF